MRLGLALFLALAACGRRLGGERGRDLQGVPAWFNEYGDSAAGGDSGASGGDVRGGGDSGTGGGSGDTADTTGDAAGWGDAGGGSGDARAPGDTALRGDSALPPGDTAAPAGLWIEASYRYDSPGGSPYSPDLTGSLALFAPRDSSWPYVHVPDGGAVVNDPIGGSVLELGCNDRFRLFFGTTAVQFARAVVTVEGRSRATSASVDLEVWNPASGAFVATASMSNDWDADTIEVEFDAMPGDDFQAVEVSPYARSCNLAIRRVRLTLYTQ